MSIFEDEILNNTTKYYPDLNLSQRIFLLENNFDEDEESKISLKDSIMTVIEEEKMTPLYTNLCERLGWERDEDFEARIR